MKFADLQLHASLLQALADSGYTEATGVQQQAIPAVLGGRDLMVSSQTGSGKTAAFMLPALHHLADQPKPTTPGGKTPNQQRQSDQSRTHGHRPRFQPAQPKVLVLAPTRELALQVTAATEKYAAQLRFIKAVAILGGMPYPKQMQLLARNPQILVATPGRLIDHITSGKIDLSQLDMLVLDEADRMLDMGFIDDIEQIVAATPTTRQTLLFSATLEGQVGQMAQRITRDPLVINVAGATTKHENIEQRLHFADDLAHKNRLLDHLLRDASIDQCVVFTATKRDADILAERLNMTGFASAALHGDMHQGARNRTLRAVREGEVRILVATDVAARGIDVPSISHVINYDLPKNPEDYVHRIGRTGRAGRNGLAVSLANHGEHFNVRNIERFTKQPIPVTTIAGLEPQRSSAPRHDKPRKGPWKPGNKPGYGNAGRSDKPYGKSFGNSYGKSDGPRVHTRDGQSRPAPAPAPAHGNDNQQRRSAGQRHQFGDR
ncbi:MAG: DEAD/DEAH box helicase [Sterolibacterium sp.]|jgi:superfamily II DNA/RNA helicase|nr:DEAD/DEAH box helicase [Sterolibacterium sp.]